MAERISVSLALAALEDQCAVVQECDTRLTEALHVRNTLIRDALLSGVPYPRVARITGLFAQQEYNLEAIICVPLLPTGAESRMLLLVNDAPNLVEIERQLNALDDVLVLRHRADLSPEFFLWMDEMGAAAPLRDR